MRIFAKQSQKYYIFNSLCKTTYASRMHPDNPQTDHRSKEDVGIASLCYRCTQRVDRYQSAVAGNGSIGAGKLDCSVVARLRASLGKRRKWARRFFGNELDDWCHGAARS